MMRDRPIIAPAALHRLSQRGAEVLVRSACGILPRCRESWSEAIAAEARALADEPAGCRFSLSAALALFVIAFRDALRGRVADLGLVITASLIGISTAVMDLSIGSRVPMMVVVGIASFALAAIGPRAAWRWPMLIGGVLPLIVLLTGRPGPYAYDGGDQWYCGAFSAICTTVGVATARLLK